MTIIYLLQKNSISIYILSQNLISFYFLLFTYIDIGDD